MKPYQEYIASLNKVHEYKVKIAGTNPTGEVMERIKHAVDAYEVDTVTAPKSMPIQEHRDFPKMGPCECWTFEVAVKYPTTANQIRQLIKERAGINADCVCVYEKNAYEFNEEFEAHGKDHEGALLADPDLKDEAGAQDLVGQSRKDSLLKELGSRTYEFAAKEKTNSKTTNQEPTSAKSPVGSTQNKIPTPPKGSVR